MNRNPRPGRRLLALAATAFLGVVAALAVASPASAHHTTVEGHAVCDPKSASWDVTWTVTNSETDITGVITHVAYNAGDAPTVIVPGAVLPKQGDGPLVGHQQVHTSGNVTLAVSAEWHRGDRTIRNTASGTVVLTGTCPPPTSAPSATFTSACDGSVTVALVNGDKATRDARFTVTGSGGFTTSAVVKPGDQTTVTVPAANAAAITVVENRKTIAQGHWTRPDQCGVPAVSAQSDCDSFTVTVENPQNSQPVTAVVTPSTGTPSTLTVAPGEARSVTVKASANLSATVTIAGKSTTVTYTKPQNCQSLPVTGSSTGTAIGIAAALLAAGAGLFLLFRRRRVTFVS
ncbi:MAG TPA: LPXTG cell wall anchor domain-containing protein [Micromonosporaceae bacterium]